MVREKVQRYGIGLGNDTVRNAVIIKELRDIFEAQGALIKNGEEVCWADRFCGRKSIEVIDAAMFADTYGVSYNI